MTKLISWNPYRELVSLQSAVDQMLEQRFNSFLSTTVDTDSPISIPLDMYEKNGDIVVRTDLPGIKAKDLNLSIEDNILKISGEFKSETDEKDSDIHLQELHYGKFQRSVKLPTRVDPDQAEVIFKDGILKLTLPKTDEGKPKQISIKTQS